MLRLENVNLKKAQLASPPAPLVEDELRFASSPNIVAFQTKDFDHSLASLNKALPSENLRLLPARCRMELPHEIRKTQSENQ